MDTIILPRAENAFIPQEKLKAYVLNPNHPSGKEKALLFKEILGFDDSEESVQLLTQRILKEIARTPAKFTGEDDHGRHYRAVLHITGRLPGRSAFVETGWICAPGSDIPRLVTAFLQKKREEGGSYYLDGPTHAGQRWKER